MKKPPFFPEQPTSTIYGELKKNGGPKRLCGILMHKLNASSSRTVRNASKELVV